MTEQLETKVKEDVIDEKPSAADYKIGSALRGISDSEGLRRSGVNISTVLRLYTDLLSAGLREVREDSDSFPRRREIFAENLKKGARKGKGAIASGVNRLKTKGLKPR